MSTPFKPTREQLDRAVEKRVPDLIAPDLRVLFCGINPGLYSGATGHHFARPGNRFWPALALGGFTPKILSPFDEAELLELGIGITNFVMRTTARADELSDDEIRSGAKKLRAKVIRHRPRVLAVLGVGAFRIGFGVKKARLGIQEEKIGDSIVWILPNPSGLNAHFTPKTLGKLFGELREFVDSI